MRTAHLLALAGVLTPSLAFAEAKPACPKPKPNKAPAADARVRQVAQRGLDYLVRASKAWTKQHKCYGCHVQAVTLEGLTVGRHNKYEVASDDVSAMVAALEMGVTAGGRRTGVAFQGAAWARYDQWIDGGKQAQLLRYAGELLEFQKPNGEVPDDDRRPPVVAGTMQTTYQAMQTWRQAYARTADENWLPPMRRAEGYIAKNARAWNERAEHSLLDLNYALMGLMASGMKASEPVSKKLIRMLVTRRNRDGGWGLTKGRSDALATGQTLYALELAGFSDAEGIITAGRRWLIEHQKKDGSWGTVKSGQSGADKGEAMWAVLGLVSVDVMSIDLIGLRDGQRLDRKLDVTAHAHVNGKGGVRRLELYVDDLPVAHACGETLRHSLRPEGLPEGRHQVEVVATNREGQRTHRVFDIYTGDIFMTHLGARFDERQQHTEVSLRNLAGAGRIRLEIRTLADKPKTIFSKAVKAELGAMTLTWNGRGNDGKARERGRYTARVTYVDARGRALQTEDVVFFHDTLDAQRASYAEVQGKVRLKKHDKDSANTVVELVDRLGNVVQSTRTTAQGNYRFKNVDEGKYRVRVKKRGWKAQEAEVEAAKASAPATADMDL